MAKHGYACYKEEREGKVDLRRAPIMTQTVHGRGTGHLARCADREMQR